MSKPRFYHPNSLHRAQVFPGLKQTYVHRKQTFPLGIRAHVQQIIVLFYFIILLKRMTFLLLPPTLSKAQPKKDQLAESSTLKQGDPLQKWMWASLFLRFSFLSHSQCNYQNTGNMFLCWVSQMKLRIFHGWKSKTQPACSSQMRQNELFAKQNHVSD